MKKIIIAFVVFVAYCASSYAQESPDYYKFDDYGYLSEFKLTLPDNTIIKYRHRYNEGDRFGEFIKDGDYAIIQYPDGTTIDFIESYFNGEYDPDAFPAIKVTFENPNHSGYYAVDIKDWYKQLRKTKSAPTGPDILNHIFGLREYAVTFPDNSMIQVKCGAEDMTVDQINDVDENGNSICQSGWDLKALKVNRTDFPILNDSGRIIPTDCIVSGQYDQDLEYRTRSISGKYHTYLSGRVLTKEGNVYVGSFGVAFKPEANRILSAKSPWLRAVSSDKVLAIYSLDNLEFLYYVDGNIFNKENKIVGMIRKGESLDEFDMESVLVAEQGKVDREKAASKKATSEKNAIIAKYGKKNADAFFAGKVIAGMPWSLVELGIDAELFKDFSCALLSIDRNTTFGIRRCYSLYGFNLAYRGFIWVHDGVVESVTLL